MAVGRTVQVSTVDVIDRILDKGIVVEYEAGVTLLGIDLCTTIEARVVMASIETFTRYAPALSRTDRVLRILERVSKT
jgi:hypothetical protein